MAIHFVGLLCLILTFGCCPGYANPPRLNVTEEYAIDTRTTNTLSIRCEGVRPLHWNWTTSLEPDDPILNITYDKHPNTDYPYVSTLTVSCICYFANTLINFKSFLIFQPIEERVILDLRSLILNAINLKQVYIFSSFSSAVYVLLSLK
ncbi:hypothetical protein SK128_024463 [Halocaridina rubra]|uniref:Uncharacterized protein n=1 Tax=Halocaridina rubra TaxID=373956 RepID=A0AAN8XMB1_HALRR